MESKGTGTCSPSSRDTVPQQKHVLVSPKIPPVHGLTPHSFGRKVFPVSLKMILGSSSGNWDRAMSDWGVQQGAPSAPSPIPVGTARLAGLGPSPSPPLAWGHFSLPLWALAGHRGDQVRPKPQLLPLLAAPATVDVL